jgi:hypothetical protein
MANGADFISGIAKLETGEISAAEESIFSQESTFFGRAELAKLELPNLPRTGAPAESNSCKKIRIESDSYTQRIT